MFINLRVSGPLTVLASVSLVAAACGGDDPTATPVPQATPTPTTPSPTATPTAAATATPVPVPTATLVPTQTPAPVNTPTSVPTNTPAPPTATPRPTPVPPTPTPTVPAVPGAPTEITLTPVLDGTIWENEGATANGAGPHLYAGNNRGSQARRALIKFDISGAVPAGSTIVSASAQLITTQSPQGGGSPAMFSLHRLLAEWNTNSSNAGTPGGSGAGAVDSDVTWTHRELGGAEWATVGGDFEPIASAETLLSTWESNTALVADVQAWLDDPIANHGWMVIGIESGRQTVRRFSSSEGSSPPTLTIVFVTGG